MILKTPGTTSYRLRYVTIYHRVRALNPSRPMHFALGSNVVCPRVVFICARVFFICPTGPKPRPKRQNPHPDGERLLCCIVKPKHALRSTLLTIAAATGIVSLLVYGYLYRLPSAAFATYYNMWLNGRHTTPPLSTPPMGSDPRGFNRTLRTRVFHGVSNCNLRRRFLILSKSAAFDSVRFSTWKRQEGGWRVQGGRREEGETAPEEFVTPLLRLAETWPFFSWILARESA